jgi:two-component system nitrogen regulation response regulator NtrX
MIHRLSSRSSEPFVEVNCAAIPEDLIESELFGHKKGAFTGADSNKIGKFEQADSGNIFLDEIGDMSLKTQAKVLRALEEHTIQPVGDIRNITVDVRVIAATNKNLDDEIRKGNFRQDLYFRLNVIPIYIPSLRERLEDLPLLIEHFQEYFSNRNGIPKKKFTHEAFNLMTHYSWPGNIRELRNIIERIYIMHTGDTVDGRALKFLFSKESDDEYHDIVANPTTLKESMENFEKHYILYHLKQNSYSMHKTASILGIERTSLYRKLKKYKLNGNIENAK